MLPPERSVSWLEVLHLVTPILERLDLRVDKGLNTDWVLSNCFGYCQSPPGHAVTPASEFSLFPVETLVWSASGSFSSFVLLQVGDTI